MTRTAWATVPSVLAALAFLYPGAPVSQVDLNDGSVWLTNLSAHKIGRYNPVVEELNAGLVSDSPRFDVLQDGLDVLLVETTRVSVIDPASVTLGAQAAILPGSVVSMAAGTTAVTRPSDGSVWARPTGEIGSLDMEGDEPDLELGPGSAAVVARSGLLLGVTLDGVIQHARVHGAGAAVTDAGHLGGTLSGPVEQVTAVGDEIVVLAGGTVHMAGGATDLSSYGDELTLQQPGPSADVVLVATSTALLEVPLDGDAPSEHRSGGSGTPAAPIRAGGCVHAAWASQTGSYLYACGGDDPEVLDLTEIASSSSLVFRVNRDVVVLNDVMGGRIWLPSVDRQVRDPNWEDIGLQEEVDNPREDEQERVATQELRAECTPSSAPPTASDDEYGIRPGQTVILPVVDNDVSSACGILSVAEFEPIDEEFGTLTLVQEGRAFQLAANPTADGTVEFTYTVTDARGEVASSTATVRVTAHPVGQNSPPEQVRAGSMFVEQGGSATYNVMADFRDPDGDSLVLLGATAEQGGAAYARGDGQLRFQSDGATLGRQTVQVLVSDGIETVEGVVYVDVRSVGSLAPVIDPIHVVTYVDEPIVLHPLDHVRTQSREPARLTGVDPVPGLDIATDLTAGTFTVTSSTAGSYYLSFVVTAAPQQSTGMVRLDVLERPETMPPPVATLDLALLPPGGEVTIDPLANDVDPSGGVLVIQSVDVPVGSGLRVAVLDHGLLRITATRTLEAAVAVGYTISNGSASATGQVLVQPVPASATQQAPVVPDVEATVRVGGVVTIPVLADAYDPDGDAIRLEHELAEPIGHGEGLMFVSGDTLRYQAPDRPTEVHATFTVADPFGNVTAATVTVSVRASGAQDKPLPRPLPLTARVYQGETVRIRVPLAGIDADGDAVVLLGVDQAPAKGRVTSIGPDWLEYEALPAELGTDTFTYAVQDWAGQTAIATVKVGIVPRPTTPAQVICLPDAVSVRPGQLVEVRVLANDVDTEGGELTIDEVLEKDPGVDAVVVGDRVAVTTTGEGVLQIAYTARNVRGGRDTAVLTVTVSDDAPFLAPIARDVVVPATDTVNAISVEVDVLAVAENPSGPLSDLAVSVHPSASEAATVTDEGLVVVTLADHAQTLAYLLTNTDPRAEGIGSYAFITVPAMGDFPPVRRPGAPELVVVAGETLEIPLSEQVDVADGRTARIGDLTTVSATKSDGSVLVIDDHTLRFAAPVTYAGPASVTALISDGSASDPRTRSTMMTFPITVLAAVVHPPTFTPSTLDVAAGETVSVDLTTFTSAPVSTAAGEDQYTYRLAGDVPGGFDVSVRGSVLTVTAHADVTQGTLASVRLNIGYGDGGVLPGAVGVRVVATSRPLARVVSVTIDGVQGQDSAVSVLDGAYNPFADVGPLTVVDAVVETPMGGTATVAGSQVVVRPAADFVGSMVTRFTVSDATGDPHRMVEGRITATVRGRPNAPTAPRVAEVRDGTVVLEWDAPANNGAPITGYRVAAVGGGVERDCASTTCTIDGLTNGVEYRFIVTAGNSVGWSDASPPSPPAVPDVRPFAPAAPDVEWQDQAVLARWSAPENPGSPIVRYEVEISPDPAGSGRSTTGTAILINSLTNGQEYRIRVRAVNGAPEPGDWSEWSAPAVPASRPDAPASITATNQLVGAGTPTMTVTWTAAASNGDAISAYEVRVDGSPAATVGGGTLSYSFTAVTGHTYTLSVVAQNKAGWGPAATTTGMIWTAPGVPTSVTAADGPPGELPYGNGAIVVGWNAPSDTGGEGIAIDHYEIEGVGSTIANHQMIRGVVGGQSYSYRVRAVNANGAASAWVTSSAAIATTAPASPQLAYASSIGGGITVAWLDWDNGGTDEGLAVRYVADYVRPDGTSVHVSANADPDGIATFGCLVGSTLTISVSVGNVRGWSGPTTWSIPVVE